MKIHAGRRRPAATPAGDPTHLSPAAPIPDTAANGSDELRVRTSYVRAALGRLLTYARNPLARNTNTRTILGGERVAGERPMNTPRDTTSHGLVTVPPVHLIPQTRTSLPRTETAPTPVCLALPVRCTLPAGEDELRIHALLRRLLGAPA